MVIFVFFFRLGIDDETCAKQISTLPMTPTTLGTKCAIDHGSVTLCPEFAEFRTYDGSCNHRRQPSLGRSLTAYNRILAPAYEDGEFLLF